MKRITPEQCRAGRAFLNISRDQLAERAGTNVKTITRFENEETKQLVTKTNARIVSMFEMSGLILSEGGIRPSDNVVSVLEGEDANRQLLEDIYSTLKDTGGEILIAGLREPAREEDPENFDFLKAHLARLQDANISERILIAEGDTNFVAPRSWYKWLPKQYFSSTTFQLYADKLAMIQWGEPQTIVLCRNPLFAKSFRGLFEHSWDNAHVPPAGEANTQ